MAMASSATPLSSSSFFHSHISKTPFFLLPATVSNHDFSSLYRFLFVLQSQRTNQRALRFRSAYTGYPLIIGRIDIPHDRGCEAHSDVDAILGALRLPDIGQIFPDSDPKWKGAASCVFIKEAVRLMDEAGYEIGNLDATLILQRPKISPHKETTRSNLSKLLGTDPSVVNLKAKTEALQK